MNLTQIVEIASKIIYSHEGNYGSVNRDDNGAISVGKVQWHGNRALNLMRTICKALGASQSTSILGATLYAEITAIFAQDTTQRQKLIYKKLLNFGIVWVGVTELFQLKK